jgi:thiosulfate/3-mercaptopyruvate sulfurtransferase
VPRSPLITAAELSNRLEREKLLLLDARSAEAFATGHLAGAVNIDLWGFSLIDTNPAPLAAFLWMIEHVLALRGVRNEVPIVVYGETSDERAARVFWFLDYFGHPDVCVLDGGVTAWKKAGLPLTTEVVTPQASNWTGVRRVEAIATWRDVADRLDRSDTAIVDTRSEAEHRGTLVRAARGGAIPGSVHLEWKENLTPEGTFKSPDALRAMYEGHDVTADREVVTYCQGGYRAAHSYLALKSLGYPRVRNYLGSWKEWGDSADLPVAIKNLEARS